MIKGSRHLILITMLAISFNAQSLDRINLSVEDLKRTTAIEHGLKESPLFHEPKLLGLNSSTNFNLKIPLTIMVLDRSAWSSNRALNEIRLAEEVFSQCEISFSPITLIHSNTSMTDPYNHDGTDTPFFVNNPINTRPLIIVDHDSNIPKRSNRGGYANYAAKTLNPYTLNTGFLFENGVSLQRDLETARKLSPNYKPQDESFNIKTTTPEIYSILAHELGHILFNSKHSKTAYNLLYFKSDFSQLGHHINSDQCQSINEDFFTQN